MHVMRNIFMAVAKQGGRLQRRDKVLCPKNEDALLPAAACPVPVLGPARPKER